MKGIMLAGTLAVTTALIGCDGGSDGGSGGEAPREAAGSELTSLLFVDAANVPLRATTVEITASCGKTGAFLTNEEGRAHTNLMPDTYTLLLTNDYGLHHEDELETGDSPSATLVVPYSCTEEGCEDLSERAITGSLSGRVYSQGGPLPGAQVSLSAGVHTNGAYASAVTDAEGRYFLLINVSTALSEALRESTLTVEADGYAPQVHPMEVTGGNIAGRDFTLNAATAGSLRIWRETFEDDSPTRNLWSVEGGHEDENWGWTGWQLLRAGHGTRNTLIGSRVKLAPDDQSEGQVPDPARGQVAYWYGNTASGNFIGTPTSTDAVFDGGTSTANHRGTLTSPPLNLSSLGEEIPASLSFRTWWEIESVNPNASGYDLMTIHLSTDGGESWQQIARLNPLSDPQSELDHSPLPYSNLGFNRAPMWLRHEAIALPGVQGQSDVRIQFRFDTVDQLFNGFRGWLIDDVVLEARPGTFMPVPVEVH